MVVDHLLQAGFPVMAADWGGLLTSLGLSVLSLMGGNPDPSTF